jgi:tetratricopeptide (TPR) repeat protein
VRFKFLTVAAALLASAAPASAAWHESKSRHFVIYGDASPEWMRAYSIKLEKFDQAVRELQNMDDPPPGAAGRVTIFVMPNADAVSKLVVGKKSNIGGYYMPRAGGSLAFVPKRSKYDGEEGAELTLFHEYAHHLMFQSTEAPPPAWLVEGFAEFYSAAKFEKNDVVRLAMPLGEHAFGLYKHSRPTPEAMFGSDVDMLASEEVVGAFYGWSWLYTHYLTFSDERSGQLDRYLAALRDGDEPMAAARKAFGDLGKLGDDARRYLERNSFKNWAVKRPPPDPSTIAVRPLRPGEVAAMPIIMDLRKPEANNAAEVAARARAAAAKFPADPVVQGTLAEAELAAFNYDAAVKAAARATELDPGNGDAWILLGRAQMELANGGGTDADWANIRAKFLKANAIDKEDAEPLLLYYQSFGRAGQPATKNAKEGLDYALVLAPQDPGLRVTAAFQQLADKRMSEARRSLLPLAFSPHPSEARDRARKAVAAIDAQNAKDALKALSR